MLNEIIVVNRDGTDSLEVPAHSIMLPSLKFFTLFMEDQLSVKTLEWVDDEAQKLLRIIRERDRKLNYRQELFRLDIPDLWPILEIFPKEERAIVMTFWSLYDGMVHYFLPNAEVTTYSRISTGEVIGKRYCGLGWFSGSEVNDCVNENH